jgi:hypothetical protein
MISSNFIAVLLHLVTNKLLFLITVTVYQPFAYFASIYFEKVTEIIKKGPAYSVVGTCRKRRIEYEEEDNVSLR